MSPRNPITRSPIRGRGRGSDLAPLDPGEGGERRVAERILRLPEPFQPFFADFRAHVRAEATEYVKVARRPRSPREFKAFVAGFLERLSVPLDLTQRAVIEAAYRWPVPMAERGTKVATAAVSAGAAGYGQTVAYGSAFSATAGTLAVAVVGELLELYAIASARTSSYRWAGLYPGEKVIGDDLAQIFGPKQLLAQGTIRHVGDEYLTLLLDLVQRSIVDSVVVPLLGPVRAAYRSVRNVDRAYRTPLTKVIAGENRTPPDPTFTFPRYAALLEQTMRYRQLPALGESPT